MIPYVRGGVASFAVILLAACGSSSLETSSSALGGNTCYPSTFACDGNTPGFWSNKNGCEALNADAQLLTELNAFLTEAGRPTVTLADDCAAFDELLKVNAVEMSDKLVAMFSAFLLNDVSSWVDGCNGAGIAFAFDASRWAATECRTTVAGWFGPGPVSFADLRAAVLSALGSGSRCEQEALKDFLDAANNDAQVCTCGCVTGATGGSGL